MGAISAQSHDGCGRTPVERNSVLTFRSVAAALDETISKIGAAGSELPQRLRDDFRAFNHQLFASQ
jgi:hypothetical protein